MCLIAYIYLINIVLLQNQSTHIQYYFFEMPEPYERQAPIPKLQITLTTKEEVQAFFNFISDTVLNGLWVLH